jgi:hypothetical protein
MYPLLSEVIQLESEFQSCCIDAGHTHLLMAKVKDIYKVHQTDITLILVGYMRMRYESHFLAKFDKNCCPTIYYVGVYAFLFVTTVYLI